MDRAITPFGDKIIEEDDIRFTSFGGMVIRDWTHCQGWAAEDGLRFSRQKSANEHVWNRNLEANLPYIDKSLENVKPESGGKHEGQTCFLTADGFSLSKNGHHLIDCPHVIETNRVYPGVQPEYYVSVDCGYPFNGSNPEWVCDVDKEKTTGVFSVFVRPEIAKKFSNKLWFDAWGKGRVLSNRLNKEKPFVKSLDTALNVSFTALCLAWRLGFKRIVLAGFDYCYQDGYNHFLDSAPTILTRGGKLQIETNERELLEKGRNTLLCDNGVFSTKEWLDAMKYFATQCWFLIESGVEIVNATEGGILNMPFIPSVKLLDEVSKVKKGNECQKIKAKS